EGLRRAMKKRENPRISADIYARRRYRPRGEMFFGNRRGTARSGTVRRDSIGFPRIPENSRSAAIVSTRDSRKRHPERTLRRHAHPNLSRDREFDFEEGPR